MSFDWKEYFDLALELAGQPKVPSTEEAKLRTAISRAYYAAFGKARNRLTVTIPSGVGMHKFVWDQFKNSANPAQKSVGQDGDRLRGDRNKADYEDRITNLPALTTKALAISGKILSRLP